MAPPQSTSLIVRILSLVANLILPGLGTLLLKRIGAGLLQLSLFLVGLPFGIILLGVPMVLASYFWALSSSVIALVRPTAKVAEFRWIEHLVAGGAVLLGAVTIRAMAPTGARPGPTPLHAAADGFESVLSAPIALVGLVLLFVAVREWRQRSRGTGELAARFEGSPGVEQR